jgi:hypothetical protein
LIKNQKTIISCIRIFCLTVMTDPSAQPIASPSTSASRVDEKKKSRGFVGCLLLHAAKKVGIIEETVSLLFIYLL